MNNDSSQDNTRKNKITLLLLAAFFAIPYLVVFIYQSYPELSIKTGMSNKGDLFSPVHSIKDVATKELKELEGKWTMIYVSGASCNQECLNQHYTMRQVRLATGKRRYKIQRISLITADKIDSDYTKALMNFPDEKQVFLNFDDKVLQHFDDLPIKEQTGRIYLMDPFLNIALRYSAQTNPKDLLHDINKLILE